MVPGFVLLALAGFYMAGRHLMAAASLRDAAAATAAEEAGS